MIPGGTSGTANAALLGALLEKISVSNSWGILALILPQLNIPVPCLYKGLFFNANITQWWS